MRVGMLAVVGGIVAGLAMAGAGQVFAQQCAPTTVIQYFVCVSDERGRCEPDYRGNQTYSCSVNDPACETTEGVCSSNDEELCYNNTNPNCFLPQSDCSPGNCWTSGGGGYCNAESHPDCVGGNVGDACGNGGRCQDNNGDGQCGCGGESGGGSDPVGAFSGFSCSYTGSGWVMTAAAWAGDADDIDRQTEVRFYVDDASGSDQSRYVGSVWTDFHNPANAETICNAIDSGANCFVCDPDDPAYDETVGRCRKQTNGIALSGGNANAINNVLADGNPHTIYARVVNVGGGNDVVLGQSVGGVVCSVPSNTAPRCDLVEVISNGNSVVQVEQGSVVTVQASGLSDPDGDGIESARFYYVPVQNDYCGASWQEVGIDYSVSVAGGVGSVGWTVPEDLTPGSYMLAVNVFDDPDYAPQSSG